MSHVQDTEIVKKTLELCQTILDQPAFQSHRLRIDTFLANDAARNQYQKVVEKSQELQQKQQFSMPLTDAEISEFESSRQALMENDVARGFMDAQQEFHRVQETITRYVHKTFEIGRLPTPEDFSSCGQGCSCGH